MLISFNAFSSDISFNWLKSETGENSALSGKCNFINSSNELDCNLRQISVRKKSSFEDAQAEINNITKELDTLLETQSLNDIRKKHFSKICTALPERQDKVDATTFNKFKQMCEDTTRESIIDVLTISAKNSILTCRVMERDIGNYKFLQVNEKKWVSTNEPSGECGIVLVATFERYKNHLWSYSQVRHYTNTETKVCKSLSEINEPISYSWKGTDTINMNCQFIEFGI